MTTISQTAVLALVLSVVAGCHSRPPHQDRQPLPDPGVVLESVRARAKGRTNLRASGRVTYFGDKGRIRLRSVLLAARDASFRVETISPFEQPIDVMACNGEQLWLLSQGRLKEGAATPENIARLLPMLLYPSEVVDVLLGGVPTSQRFVATALEWDEAGKDWLMTLEDGAGGRSQIALDPASKQVRRLALLHPKTAAPRVEVRFKDYETLADGSEFPEAIVVRMPAEDLEVEIRLKEIETNVTIAPELFRLEAPPSTPPEPF